MAVAKLYHSLRLANTNVGIEKRTIVSEKPGPKSSPDSNVTIVIIQLAQLTEPWVWRHCSLHAAQLAIHAFHGSPVRKPWRYQHEIWWSEWNHISWIDLNCWQIFIKLILYQQVARCLPQLAGDPVGSCGLRLKPTKPIGKSCPGFFLHAMERIVWRQCSVGKQSAIFKQMQSWDKRSVPLFKAYFQWLTICSPLYRTALKHCYTDSILQNESWWRKRSDILHGFDNDIIYHRQLHLKTPFFCCH